MQMLLVEATGLKHTQVPLSERSAEPQGTAVTCTHSERRPAGSIYKSFSIRLPTLNTEYLKMRNEQLNFSEELLF